MSPGDRTVTDESVVLPRMPVAATALTIVLATAISTLLIAPAAGYDSWAWLHWGREVVSLSLSTAEGPAFKPLPVAVCTVLSLLAVTRSVRPACSTAQRALIALVWRRPGSSGSWTHCPVAVSQSHVSPSIVAAAMTDCSPMRKEHMARTAVEATGGTSTMGSIGGSAASEGAPATSSPPAWAQRMKRHQTMSHGATAAAHAVKSGDSHGGGASVSLRQDDR